jgi:hypothetical protein
MDHVRGAPYHPQTQGKIERRHQTLKNRILLENYFLPGDLNANIERFVTHYNHHCHHESLSNLTPADIYLGATKLFYSNAKGQNETQSINGDCNTAIEPPNIEQQMSQALPYIKQASVPKNLTTDSRG